MSICLVGIDNFYLNQQRPRTFTGVCIWEILMNGVKPWQGLRNHEVILRVERGEILPQPESCPHALYTLLKEMWRVEEKLRPSMPVAMEYLNGLMGQIREGRPPEDLMAP